MSTLTPKQVGDEMSMYTFRPGVAILPRGRGNFKCFDKGHYRLAANAPRGFVPVPERVVLEHFGTKYTLNVRKLERAMEEYAKGSRRPTLRSLYLETPSEFELALRPLISFYYERLRMSFSSILNSIALGRDWKTQVNNLRRQDQNRNERWRKARGVIYVRLRNFTKLEGSASLRIPPYTIPYPTTVVQPVPQPTPLRFTRTAKDDDLDMLKRVNMGRSTKYRNLLLHMSPWKSCIRVASPFRSREYNAAYDVAQTEFERRYNAFKAEMDKKRNAFRKQWAAYKAYKDDQNSIRPGNVPYAERPGSVSFDNDWADFIFGMKQEMKEIEFVPIPQTPRAPRAPQTPRAPPAPQVPPGSTPTSSHTCTNGDPARREDRDPREAQQTAASVSSGEHLAGKISVGRP